MTPAKAILAAGSVAELGEAEREQLRGRRVKVLRAVVYEGEGGAVLEQLARSLPEGTREVRRGEVLITVTQGGLHDLGAWTPRPPMPPSARKLAERLALEVASEDAPPQVARLAGELLEALEAAQEPAQDAGAPAPRPEAQEPPRAKLEALLRTVEQLAGEARAMGDEAVVDLGLVLELADAAQELRG